MIKYSIIICSYNRYKFLLETIESVLNVLKDRKDFELLIVDNKSTDSTFSLKQKYNDDDRIKYFIETQQGLSYARNRGIKEAIGKILVYLDDDIELVDDYFDICDVIFSDEKIVISGGKVLPYKVSIPKWLPKPYYHLVSVYDLGDDQKYVKYLMGGNFAIRRKVAQSIGLYDTDLGRKENKLAGGEEIDYQNRAHSLGHKMYYHPRQNILHKINEKLNEKYVLTYAYELGKSERIIDQSVSNFKVKKKIIKSYVAISLYFLFKDLASAKNRIMYLKIVHEYAKGYILNL